jgi:uncharacterized protein (UPF0335 family)
MEILRKIFKKKPKKIKEVLPTVENKTFENKVQKEILELRKSMKEANNKLLGKN